MQTTITERGPNMYTLEIRVAKEDMAEDVDRALRRNRRMVPIKGFRPGRMPLDLFRKLHGKDVAKEVLETVVAETYEDLVKKSGKYDVCVGPIFETKDYELDGDLHAVVEFGVEPKVVLKDLSGVTVETMVHTVTDEEVDGELAALTLQRTDYLPADESVVEDSDYVVYDVRKLDRATGVPLVGEGAEEIELYVDDALTEGTEYDVAVAKALLGVGVGEAVALTVESANADGLERYLVTVREIKRPVKPEWNDEFAADSTGGECTKFEQLKPYLRERLESRWARRCMEFRSHRIRQAMVDLHGVEVPDLLVLQVFQDYTYKLIGSHDPSGEEAELIRMKAGASWNIIREHLAWKRIQSAVVDAHLDELSEMIEGFAAPSPKEVSTAGDPLPHAEVRIGDDTRLLHPHDVVPEFLARQITLVEKESSEIWEEDGRRFLGLRETVRAALAETEPAEEPSAAAAG